MDLIKIIKNNLVFIVLSITSVLIIWPLLIPGYFSHHDDLQVMRIFEMRKCLSDFQIPCRWVSDMGYGNGYPLFNYYNPFAFYIGGILSFIFGYVLSAKILFFIAAILGGISMYFLAREIFGKSGGLVAAILYQFAPYRALDLYVRGALAESFAISLVPFCFFFALKFLKEKSVKHFLGLSLSIFALLTSHNIMTIFFIPYLLVFTLAWKFWENGKNILMVILSITLGFGLAAFFIIPSFFEKNLVQIENLTRLDLNFRAHFATLSQLFIDRSWGYGASMAGSFDTISLQIGWPHWVLAFASAICALIFLKRKSSKIALLFFIVFLLSIFMTHIRSAFIWEEVGILHFAQFPWRFLAVSIFSASLLGGYLVSIYEGQYKNILISLLIILIVTLNFEYFKPEKFYQNMSDQQKLSGEQWEIQQKAAILDYLPKTAVQPREAAPNTPVVIFGQAEITNFVNRSNRWNFNIKVLKDISIEMPVFDFPNWQVKTNGKVLAHNNENHLGRIAFQLKEGDYFVEGNFKNTPIRSLANTITLISTLILVTFYGKRRKIFK